MAEKEDDPIRVTVEPLRSLKPEWALIIYSAEPSALSCRMSCEAIRFRMTEDGAFVDPHALDMRCMQDIFNRATGSSGMEFLDKRILAVSNTSIVWYEPSRKAEIFFDCTEANRKDLNALCKGRKVRWPALLFKLEQETLYCRALADSRRPNPQSKLYVAPLTHIDTGNGRVCTPRNLRFAPEISMTANMRRYSEDFYRGIFGHATYGEFTTHSGGHDGLWREILQNPSKRFPVQYLKETAQTLRDFLK